MNYIDRCNYLRALFEYDRTIVLGDRPIGIRPFLFQEHCAIRENRFMKKLVPDGTEFCLSPDNLIAENKRFTYSVFVPNGHAREKECILLLHGLNERSWDKYLAWAEYLCNQTGRPVILFPIAFHMNRTPMEWHIPRSAVIWSKFRRLAHPEIPNSTFANVALSLRLAASPLRMYTSGRETLLNLWQLLRDIRSGRHPLFAEGCRINFFAYSIGALVSQIFFLGNPDGLVQDSKLFLFCGGSLFEYMNGSAREILDQAAWQQVYAYYARDYGCKNGLNKEIIPLLETDFLNKAFVSMLRKDLYKEERTTFFQQEKDRVRIVALSKDTVIPPYGAREAVGEAAGQIVKELDFPFDYTHQNPFPSNNKISGDVLNSSFLSVFGEAASFLA